MKREKIAYIDYLRYDGECKNFYGDMGYSFNDEKDSRVPVGEIENVKSNLNEYINSEDASDNCDTLDEDGGFSVFIVRTAVVEMEDEHDGLWSGDLLQETDKPVAVYVCASESVARNAVEKEFAGEKVEFHFRDDYGIFG
jgi:hypothetical protein